MTALRPDELDDDADSVDDSPRRIITFYLGEGRVTLHGGIPFGDDGALACGARHFPADLEARCCAGVLYPGAACCASTDCAAGQCADGLCVAAVPDLASAAPIHGTHRILVALADFPELATGPGGDASADPCADRPDLVATLGLDTVTGFFRGSAEARMGLDPIDFRWTILAGLDSDAIVPAGADRWLPFYRDHLADWLAAHPGCPVLDDFDQVVIASPEVDLHGFGGVFVGRGTVGTTTYASPWLFAHELGHAFGAIDLKPLFGGAFLWTRALMAVHGGADATDQVAWAEWGMGDTDGDGVVDLAELAAYPETFAVSDLRARIEPSDDPVAPVDQLVIAWSPVALEAGREKRLAHADFDVALPEHAYAAHISQGGVTKRLVLPQAALHWSDLLARGAITVTLQADHPFTRADGTRAAVHLDETVEVPLR
ncbi:MAG: hypothetical protein U1F43_09580 [Myxococcota bacterium]